MAEQREKIRFGNDGNKCVAWHYVGANGACVVMAGGAGVIKEPGTDRFARRFHEKGYSVLAFDFRHWGESDGEPRHVIRIGEQLADWDAAITCASALPEVDPTKITIWGFSLAGGEVFDVAARHPELAAAIAQTPLADGRAAAPEALRHTTPAALGRLLSTALLDAVGSLVGRPPRLIPLAGTRGEVAMLTTPDAPQGSLALDPDGTYPQWQQTVAARFALRVGSYRPGRRAASVRVPLLLVVGDHDRSAPPGPAVNAARQAPRSELVRLPGSHYAPFLEAHESVVDAELSFLNRHGQ